MYWLINAAMAGTYAGVPVAGVPGLGKAYFINPAEGWTATVGRGRVWVFVGESSDQAAAWLDRHAPLPEFGMTGTDEARSLGTQEVAFRKGNVATRVLVEGKAERVAERLRDAIVYAAPTVVAKTFDWRPCPEMLIVDAPGASAIQELGRVTVDRDHARFEPFPEAPIFVWDRWGRATRVWEPASQLERSIGE